MLNFCTLFDINYVDKGLAMYYSLTRHCNNFTLYIFAFDDPTYQILNRLTLPNVVLIHLNQLEEFDKELLNVKPLRTKAEYCWTATPSTILYVIKNYNIPICTYIDADLFFYSNPKVLIEEIANNSVLITEHRYTPKYDKSSKFGKYCVQFISFKNDNYGLNVLNWWHQKCIEWCYNRVEDGKFGDQKYLDNWTTMFANVHVLKHQGGGIAPWNVQQFYFEKIDNSIIGKQINSNQNFEVIFYHFHYVREHKKYIDLGWLELNKEVIEIFYKPYFKNINDIRTTLKTQFPDLYNTNFNFKIFNFSNIKEIIKSLFKYVFKYNIYNKKTFLS